MLYFSIGWDWILLCLCLWDLGEIGVIDVSWFGQLFLLGENTYVCEKVNTVFLIELPWTETPSDVGCAVSRRLNSYSASQDQAWHSADTVFTSKHNNITL